MAELAGLNYDSKLSIQDWQYLSSIIENEILKRTQLVFGNLSLAAPEYGVVDQLNPTSVVSTDTTRPLVVSVSSVNPLQVNITPGTVVNPNGTIVSVPSPIEGFSLPSTNAGDIHVVYVRNQIIDTAPYRITRFNTSQPVRRAQNTDVVVADSLSDFQNPSLYPTSVLANITVIAVISVAQTTSGVALQIDYTSSNYSFNRPWYSPVDVTHRSILGTGVATSNNAHALAFDDLTAGDLTLYDLLSKYGRVQSRDDDLKGIPGFRCAESITPARILTDDSMGTVTSASKYGGPLAKYVVLTFYPVHVMSFYLTAQQSGAIAYDWITGTRIIVLPTAEIFTSPATIEYNRSTAGELPNTLLSNTVVFNQPNVNSENIYTGGKAINTITNPQIGFDGSGPYPIKYEVFLNGDGTLIQSPQPIDVSILLDNIAPGPFPAAIYVISQNIFDKAQIMVGLANANPVPTMSIGIRVYGTDSNGNPISEDVTFLGSSWTPVSVPGVETATQFITTAQVFSSVTGIQVMGRTDDGPNSQIRLFAKLQSGVALSLNKLASLAKINWNGNAIASATDSRSVVATVPPVPHRYLALAEGLGLNSSTDNFQSVVFSEDLQDPKFYETTQGSSSATFSSFTLNVDDWSQFLPGDSISLRPGKALTCLTVGTPNRPLGQFLASSDNLTTANDIALTIADPTFNSGITTVITGTSPNPVAIKCTKTAAGAIGNELVFITLAEITPAASLSGVVNGFSTGGFDSYGFIHLPRHEDYLDSSLPNPIAYDVTNLPYRYMSRAFIIDQANRITVQFHGFGNDISLQLRTRIATVSNPVWQPWVVQTLDGAFATFTSVDPILRIQVEAFGFFSGISAFEGNI